MKFGTRRFEAAVAVSLTTAAVWLNFLSTTSAGGLWRDEANTVALATLPRIADVWRNLQFDSFPVVWLAIVRGFAALVGTGNDSAFRVLGFLIGVGLIAALWVNARSFGYRFPLVALSLLALAPSVVRWGDSMRAYGLGMVVIVLTISAVWKYVEAPSSRNLVIATIGAIVSVHTIYYNSILLLAICAGAFAVCLRRRNVSVGARVIGIGLVAALSLIPYASTIRGAGAWNALVRIPAFTLEWFSTKLYETLSPGGWWLLPVWIIAFLGCLAIGVMAIARDRPELSDEERDKVLFATISLAVGSIGSFLFLRALSYATQPWYYLTLLLIIAVSIDIILGVTANTGRLRVWLGAVALVVGLFSAIAGSRYLGSRLTNSDTVAASLESSARPGDMILVTPWYYGVSFDRYYHGAARWNTVPAISFHAFHRYDLVMNVAKGSPPSGVANVLDETKRTLMAGSTVFVVGAFPRASTDPRNSKPPRYAAADWSLNTKWGGELADFINLHAASATPVPLTPDCPVSRYETMTITAVRGWRE